ncbi:MULTISPECIES: transposase [Sporomusa]|uniref:transposase n=1 Tax=Sporomusa TaxID=2375 RepID=UPI00315943D1
MARIARKKSKSGTYHIMLRGINKQRIFEEEEDYEKYLQVLELCQGKSEFKLMAYCLMGNHLHLLIKEDKESLEQIFKRIGVRYVYWYNNKYNRTGHLFQDRFKSEPVDDDSYFLTVLRYIHQNPVKANLCEQAQQYKWSSYRDYLYDTGITYTEFGLSLFHENSDKAKALFASYMQEKETANCLHFEWESKRITDKEAQDILKEVCGVHSVTEFQAMDKIKRDRNIALLKRNGLSIRQISRLTGISFAIVRKV